MRWVSALVRLYPRAYRERHRDELAAAMLGCAERERRSGAHPFVTVVRLALDAAVAGFLLRRDGDGRPPSGTGDPLMQSLLYDVRHALRMLRRARLFSSLVVATLALVIGANTAIFSVVNGVLLRGLPYRQPDRLVALYEGVTPRPTPFGFSAPDLAAFRER